MQRITCCLHSDGFIRSHPVFKRSVYSETRSFRANANKAACQNGTAMLLLEQVISFVRSSLVFGYTKPGVSLDALWSCRPFGLRP